MKKAYFPLTVVGVLVVLAAILAATRGSQQAPTNEGANTPPPTTSEASPPTVVTPPNAENSTPIPNPKPAPPGATFSGEDDIMSPDVMVHEIVYNGSAYSPAMLTIKQGDIVVFKNDSKSSFWPASAPHPQHSDYPEFDPLEAIPSGQTFEFKFTKIGKWKFHDHIVPSATGVITVTE